MNLCQKVFSQLFLLVIGSFFFRNQKQLVDHIRFGKPGRFLRFQHPVVEADFIHTTIKRVAVRPATDQEGRLRANAFAQLIHCDSSFKRLAIQIDFDPSSFATSVVGHAQMVPFFRGKLGFRLHLDRIFWPLMDQMNLNFLACD